MTDRSFGVGEFELILKETQQRTGLYFRAEQLSNLQSVIERLMKRLKIGSARELLQQMRRDLNVFHAIVDEVTVGETYFFREPNHFEFVRRRLFTELRSHAVAQGNFRVWSAACAGGEEAYSLAILCKQESQRAEIMATDISPAALAKARRGEYRQWSFRGNSLAQVDPFISPDGELFRVQESIRNQVRFQLLNLASDSYPNHQTGLANFDLIFCRNVLIYFGRETINAVGGRLAACLRPGGWLITASGDPPLSHISSLDTLTTEFGTFYQRPHVGAETRTTESKTAAVNLAKDFSNTGSLAKSIAVSASSTHPRMLNTAAEEPRSRDTHNARNRIVSPDPATGSVDNSARKLTEATAAFHRGDHALATKITENLQHVARACAIHVRAAAFHDLAAATQKCGEFTDLHPLDCELHYLHARFLLESERWPEAAQAAQKALFLDGSSVMSHFLFGTIQVQRSNWQSARRHFVNARKLCERYQPQDRIPLSDDETAADVTRAAESQLARISHM